jgi:hypothetical protein
MRPPTLAITKRGLPAIAWQARSERGEVGTAAVARLSARGPPSIAAGRLRWPCAWRGPRRVP